MSTNPISSFDNVPDEIIREMIQFQSLKNLNRLQIICHRFQNIISTRNWFNIENDHIDIFVHVNDSTIMKVLEKNNLKTVSVYLQKLIPVESWKGLLNSIKTFKNSDNSELEIILLDFSGCTGITDEYLDCGIEFIQEYDMDNRPDLPMKNPQINLSGCTNITSDAVCKLKFCPYLNLSNCTQLEKVNYGYCTSRRLYFEGSGGEHHIGVINLTNCINIKSFGFLEASIVILDGCTQIKDKDFTFRRAATFMTGFSLKGTNITGSILELWNRNSDRSEVFISTKIVDRKTIDEKIKDHWKMYNTYRNIDRNIIRPDSEEEYELLKFYYDTWNPLPVCIDDCPNFDPENLLFIMKKENRYI